MLKSFSRFIIIGLIYNSVAYGKELYWMKGQVIYDSNGKSLADTNKKVKLGSLWKLYAYAFLKADNAVVPNFVLPGGDPAEAFCGKKGESIDIDASLAKSCGLFFEPKRLGSAYGRWDAFWKSHQGREWYNQILLQKQDLVVPLSELLLSLESLRNENEISAILENSLPEVVLNGTARSSLPALGSRMTVKTFTLVENKKYVGGLAGWAFNGPVVWFKDVGKSHEAIENNALFLSDWLNEHSDSRDTECVKVKHFAKYPILKIRDELNNEIIEPRYLNGAIKVEFKNGKTFGFKADGQQFWSENQITAKYSANEYIARVLEREFSLKPNPAATAMTIVIRSYLFENAKKTSDQCLSIDDSTHFQRVGINAPSKEALKISIKTSGLVLQKMMNVRYRTETWAKAKEREMRGENWVAILASIYPSSSLGLRNPAKSWRCQKISRAQKWFAVNKIKFDQFIKSKIHTRQTIDVKVCHTPYLQPFSLMNEKKIFLNNFEETEDQISLVHEYFHFYMRGTHRENDERYIDHLAKQALQTIGAI